MNLFISNFAYLCRHSIYNAMTHIEHVVYSFDRLLSAMPKQTADHYENILARLEAFPVQVTHDFSKNS